MAMRSVMSALVGYELQVLRAVTVMNRAVADRDGQRPSALFLVDLDMGRGEGVGQRSGSRRKADIETPRPDGRGHLLNPMFIFVG